MNESKPILFLDGECVLCNALGQRILKIDKHAKLLLTPLQGESADQAREKYSDFPSDLNTVVFLEAGKIYVLSDAILKMIKHLPFPHYLPAVFIYLPRSFRDFFYKIIARNRTKWFGKAETCSLLEAPENRVLK